MSKKQNDFFKTKHEWSIIKDELLGCYLKPYFQKIIKTNRPTLYIDCFAGKGMFDDGNMGSPMIALNVREEVLDQAHGVKNGIDMVFIELNHASYLNSVVSTFPTKYSKPEIISGKFEDNILDCLKDAKGKNVFLYIDPYGIKALDSVIFEEIDKLGIESFEMLINFNSFGFFRDGCRVMSVEINDDEAFSHLEELVEYEPTQVQADVGSEKLLNRIAGGDYWKNIVDRYKNKEMNGFEAEKELSVQYKLFLRKHHRYVLDLPIRLKHEGRPKYRMIHVCNHKDGCYLMAQNMLKRKEDIFLFLQQQGQMSLFDRGANIGTSAEGLMLTDQQIEEIIKDYIIENCKEEIHLTDFYASFFTDHGLLCDIKRIEETLKLFEINGLIQIIRIPQKTSTGRNSQFWSEKKGQEILLRRC